MDRGKVLRHQWEPEPYAKYKLRQVGDNQNEKTRQPGATIKHDYEDVKVDQKPRPSFQTTVTFGDGLTTPSDLFGSLKTAGHRFIGADKITAGSDYVRSGIQKFGGHGRGKCQCRHHQKKLLENENDNLGSALGNDHELFDITEQSEHNQEGHILPKTSTFAMSCCRCLRKFCLQCQHLNKDIIWKQPPQVQTKPLILE